MKHFLWRVYNAFNIGWFCFKNPKATQKSNMQMLADLLGLILKVGMEGKPRMTRVAYVHPEEGEKEIVSIWAGAGVASSPLERITELLKENDILKSQLAQLAIENPPNITFE